MRVLGRVLLAVLVLAGAAIYRAQAEPFRVNSGQVLEILSIEPEKTERGQALVMRFSTGTPLNDIHSLRKEADQLWEHLSVNAEAGNFRRAVIRATSAPDARRSVDFIYERRGPDWRTLEKGLETTGRLTETAIRALYDRSQNIIKDRNWNVALLYTAKDLSVTYSFPGVPGATPFTLDRQGTIAMSRENAEAMENYDRRSQIQRIDIAPDGQAARVESLEIELLRVNGRVVTGQARAVSDLRLRNGAIVIWRMEMTVTDVSVGVDL
ncbi:MAG: hypothetical protein OEO83_14145 [Alphaproteobacteria bacterium]|nr:hypothetical protein [Alphaproteobacteria bacterium]